MSTEGYTPVTFPSLSTTGLSTTGLSTTGRSGEPDRAFVQGHAAGYSAGLQAAAAEQLQLQQRLQQEHEEMLDAGRSALARAVQLLQAAASAAQQRQEVAVADVQDVLAVSAIELAEAILGYELAQGENTARAALKRALGTQGTGVGRVTTVRLHPRDLAALAAAGVVDVAGVELTADDTLAPGDAVGEYLNGWIDARIGAALERAKQALLGAGA
ncbi:FliH/SctL family protein [Paenarthrobacter ilicis]|uniref:Flagellar assembly protein FliH n=1 Tax=Paenarthrobacter ilicis TaxID=43665 RepID=A0ABX0TDJ2_9MICC|nr:FliH/SctL family protein [Paenarthrobacter ilicis]MBM7792249.1 flagellar assembly protein FliH [Paenarthrobacter ilicis]NIJ00593.1 flagellar assembly protein FliH [Paenarthrobacter ilicis]